MAIVSNDNDSLALKLINYEYCSRQKHDVHCSARWLRIPTVGADRPALPNVRSHHPQHRKHCHSLWHAAGGARGEGGQWNVQCLLLLLMFIIYSFVDFCRFGFCHYLVLSILAVCTFTFFRLTTN